MCRASRRRKLTVTCHDQDNGAAQPVQPQPPQASPDGVTLPGKPPFADLATDPTMRDSLETLHLSEATVTVPWEGDADCPLQPGPCGEYLEVVDVDPAKRLRL